MKKIISFSLWGKAFRYLGGALQNAELSKHYYPDWICRFYVGNTIDYGFLYELETMDNVEIIEMDEPGDWRGMFWRFYPASEEGVEAMISRDADSRPGFREVESVNEWLNSNKSFHIIRDHEYHAWPILGGMWGVKKNKISDIKTKISEYNTRDSYNTDQEFLKDIIYPIIKDDCIIHDEFFEKKPFPASAGQRDKRYFIGQAYDGNGDILNIPEYGVQNYIDHINKTEGLNFKK